MNSAPAVCKLSIRLLPRVVRAAVDHLHPPSDHAVTVWQACADAVAATIAVMVADANAVRDSMRGMAAAGLYVTAAALTAMPQVDVLHPYGVCCLSVQVVTTTPYIHTLTPYQHTGCCAYLSPPGRSHPPHIPPHMYQHHPHQPGAAAA